MRTHEVDAERLSGVEWWVWGIHFAHETLLCVLLYPLREVMLTRRVGHRAANVAYHTQEVEIVGVGGAVVLYALVHGEHVFFVCGAVELAQIDHKTLLWVYLQRLCHVWYAQKTACYM